MMEEALLAHLRRDGRLAALLAGFNGKPAVFQNICPDDNRPEWGGAQFSRVIFETALETSPERKTAGTLRVDIECAGSSTPYEEIEPEIRRLIDGTFFASGDGVMAASWQRTEGFRTDTRDSTLESYGCMLTFDLMAFPAQTERGMDPAGCVNAWTAGWLPEAKRIPVDSLPEGAWKPTDETPAVYWRLVSTAHDPGMARYDSWSVTWMQAVLRGHVLAPSPQRRGSILKQFAEIACALRQLPFPDGSPFLVNRVQADSTRDALRDGQLTLTGSYGVLRTLPQKPLQHITIQERKGTP